MTAIKLARVDVPAFYVRGALRRGSRHTTWWIGDTADGQFIRVIRSYDYPPGWHISASVGGDFGERSTRPPTDDEMRAVIEQLGIVAGAGATWSDDVQGDDPNVRHYWAVNGGAT